MKKSFIRVVLFSLFIILSVCIITGCPGPGTPDGGNTTGDNGKDPGEINPPPKQDSGNTNPDNPSNPGTDPSNPSDTDPDDPSNPGTGPSDSPDTDPDNPSNPGTDPSDSPDIDPDDPSNPGTGPSDSPDIDPDDPSTPGTDPSDPSDTDPDDPFTPTDPATGKEKAAFWGSWIRMDTGETIQINDEGVIDSWSDNYDFSKFEFESQNVLVYKDGNLNPRLFRQSGYARNFTVKVAGLENASRAAATYTKVNQAKAGVKVKRKNKNNDSDNEVITTDTEGFAEFTDAVAEEIQEITLKSGDTEVNLELTPHYDGEDMGVIPVIEDDKCSFKVTYDIYYPYGDSLSSGYMYADNNYSISLKICNIGNEEISDGYYQISCDNPKLSIRDTNGNRATSEVTMGTVEAYGSNADTKTVELRVSYSNITDAYEDVPVYIVIKDWATKREWNDCITLRFYRRPVFITVNAYNPQRQGYLHGFVIAPDGRSQYFEVDSGSEKKIAVPWSKDDKSKYTLVFSGADANSEMFYAFKVTEDSEDGSIFNWSDYLSTAIMDDQMEIKYAFEDENGNNTETTATNAGNGFTLVKSYIQKKDIDYFTLNINANTLSATVTVTPLTDISDITVTPAEADNKVTLTAEEGYDSYQWELNGKVIQISESNICIINKDNLIEGVYDLYLLASRTDSNENTEYRSSTCQFEVTGE